MSMWLCDCIPLWSLGPCLHHRSCLPCADQSSSIGSWYQCSWKIARWQDPRNRICKLISFHLYSTQWMSLSPCLGFHQFGDSGALEVSKKTRHHLCKFAVWVASRFPVSFIFDRPCGKLYVFQTDHGNTYKPLFEDSISIQFLIDV